MGDETKYKATNNSQNNNTKGGKDDAKGLSPVEKQAVNTLPGGKIASKVADTKLGKKAVDAVHKQMAKNKFDPVQKKLGKSFGNSNSGLGKLGGLAKEKLKRDGLEDKQDLGSNPGLDDSSPPNPVEQIGSSLGSLLIDFIKKHLIVALAPVLGHALLILVIILGVIAIILGPADITIKWFRDKWDSLKTLVGYKTEEQWEQEYYERLAEVQEAFNKKYGVCIDVNLITATLTVDKFSNIVTTEEGNEDADVEESDYLDKDNEKDKEDYKRMIKQIELLGNMQIKRKIYGLDKEIQTANENKTFAPNEIMVNPEADYCMEEAAEYPYPLHYGQEEIEDFTLWDTLERKLQFILETPGNSSGSFFDTRTRLLTMWKEYQEDIKGNPIRLSSTNREVASNDIVPGIWKFLTKKANEERNIEYVFYVPSYSKTEALNSDGTRKVTSSGEPMWEVRCDARVPDDYRDFAQLDVGSLNDMDSVYYWNLMDSFIADYYKDYLPDVGGPTEVGSYNYEKIKNIVEDIYLLWNEMGPSQSCTTSRYICRSDEGNEYYGGGETSLSRNEFIERIAPVAIEEMSRTGLLASVSIAQAALESGNGSSGLSSKYSNYYGLTAGNCAPKNAPENFRGRVLSTGEGGNTCKGNAFWNGSVVALCNSNGGCRWFRVYDSFANSARDYSRLITESYGCHQSNYSDLISCIIGHGYDNSSSYISSINSIVKSNNLTQYDIGSFNGVVDPIEDPLYTDTLCGSGALNGDWVNWKQYGSPWSNIVIGKSWDETNKRWIEKTIANIGCAMTSTAIQIMRSGAQVPDGFDPGVFAKMMKENGGFDQGGNIQWSVVTKIFPDFQFVDRINTKDINQIANLVNQGYYVILNVKSGRHWVAVDRIEGNKIYMFDPGSPNNEVGATYGLDSIMGLAYYRKGSG